GGRGIASQGALRQPCLPESGGYAEETRRPGLARLRGLRRHRAGNRRDKLGFRIERNRRDSTYTPSAHGELGRGGGQRRNRRGRHLPDTVVPSRSSGGNGPARDFAGGV